MRTLPLALLALVAAAPAVALEGRVTDPADKSVRGARVCYIAGGAELLCTLTDASGRFEMMDSHVDKIRAIADGFMRRDFTAADAVRPIVLQPSPILRVRLLDARTGEPLPEGRVVVVYPTGVERGPFPTNAAGVRVQRVLDAGEVRIVASAEGYAEPEPVEAKLVAGEETALVVELTPEP